MSFKRIYQSAKSELIEHKKTRIISLILIIVFGIFQYLINLYLLDSMDFYPNYLMFFILIFFLFIVCKNVFKDMYDNTAADVQMSLPLSSRERYFSHFLTIGFIFEIPFLIVSAFSNIAAFIMCRYYYLDYLKMEALGKINFHSGGQYMPVLSEYFKYELILFAVTFFVIAVTSFAVSCIGAKSEALYIPVILLSIFSLFPILVCDFISSRFIFFDIDIDNIRLLKWIPGFALLFFDIEELKITDIIVNILLSAVVLVIGMAVYEKRDVKVVGKPVVNKVFYEFLLFITSVVVFFISYVNNEFSFFIVFNLFGMIGIIILRIIGSRKEFRPVLLLKWVGVYVLYYVAFILLMFVTCKTNIFGFAEQCFKDDYSDDKYICEISILTENCDGRNSFHLYNNYHREYYADDTYSENFRDNHPYLEHSSVTLEKFDTKQLAKIFAKYNKININRPGFFNYNMFFSKKEETLKACSFCIFYNKKYSDNYEERVMFDTIYIDKSEYELMYSELLSLSQK